MNIVDPILFQCQRQPPTTAICVPTAGIGLISYWRLEQYINNVARRLDALRLPSRGVVAVNIPDTIFHLVVVLALARLGLITLSLQDGQFVPIKNDALITTTRLPVADAGRTILVDMSWTEGDGRPLESHLLPSIKAEDPCRVILTSGPSSEPRAVVVSHGLLASRIGRHQTIFGSRFGNCARIYNDLPLTNSLGFEFLLYTLWRGGTALFPGDDFDGTLRALEDYKIQCLVGSPKGFQTLLRWFDAVPTYQSNIKILICGGDVLSRSLSDRLRSRICSHLITAYGSTETGISATARASEIASAPHAAGFVTPGVSIQIVDATGTVLSPGHEGLVRVRSEYAVENYFDTAESPRSAFHDGWFYPGDVGILSAENLLSITGRDDATLNLGGDRINAESVELVLQALDGVIEAVAFSDPDEDGVNELCAAVVNERTIDEAQLRAHCEAHIAPPFAPARYYFVDRIPRNQAGKIDRLRVRSMMSQVSDRR